MSNEFTPIGMKKPLRVREALVQKQWPKKPDTEKEKNAKKK